jgi:hypothetical protein
MAPSGGQNRSLNSNVCYGRFCRAVENLCGVGTWRISALSRKSEIVKQREA